MLYQRKRVEEVDDDRLKFEISTILSREVNFVLFYFILFSVLVSSFANVQKFGFLW